MVLAVTVAERNRATIDGFWEKLYTKDWEALAALFAPDGEYTERHLPISLEEAYTLTARDRDEVFELPAGEDANGVQAPHTRRNKLRSRLSKFWFADTIQKPTREEYDEAQHHAEHELEVHAGEAHAAEGHQFDGRHEVHGEELRNR